MGEREPRSPWANVIGKTIVSFGVDLQAPHLLHAVYDPETGEIFFARHHPGDNEAAGARQILYTSPRLATPAEAAFMHELSRRDFFA